MNTAQIARINAHAAAVTKLLLGSKVMKPGLMIVASEPLDTQGRMVMAKMAAETRTDLVQLPFEIGADGMPVMGRFAIILSRDQICYSWSECRLSLQPGTSRARIVAQDGVTSHFRAIAGEIIQVPGRPAWLTAGIDRAEAKLAALVRDGVDLEGQAHFRLYAPA